MRIKGTKSWEKEYCDDMDIYSEDVAGEMLDSDSIEMGEWGFMSGYNE